MEKRATTSRDPILPTSEEAEAVRAFVRQIPRSKRQGVVRISLGNGKKNTASGELPEIATRLLLRLLREIAKGNAVTVIPYHAELTTQQAAEVLNVSRPFLIKLLEQGKMPFHLVGTHRRIRFEDVMRYKAATRSQQREALHELIDEAQELDMGYE